MSFRFLNNYSTELGVLASVGNGTITITGDGSEFADASPTQPYPLTLCERDIRGLDTRREIVHVTGRATNVLTVLRAREGTTEQEWPVGTPIEARDTAEALNESSAAVEVHEGEADPHTQYVLEIAGVEHQVIIQGTAIDLTVAGDSTTIAIPSGYVMYVDHIDLIVATSDTPGGTPSIEAGPDGVTPDTYLANSPINVTALGDREVFTPIVTAGVSQVRVAVNTAGTGTAYSVTPILRGYLMVV